ncbi:AcrR family transcriptional regulator [Mycetocola sp. CAN_C7]|uniref:TetR family transcriptional regulator n=1 Tax=Mycetocola sp. CAN_C7 TaxID=2787724 RepID=UPI0018CA9FF9
MPSPAKANRGPSAGPENRRALIDAAREVFASEGISAPLSSVARKAGVGQGSLYRHFPDRIALAAAVFEENIGELEVALNDQARTLDDLLELVVEQALVSTALIDTITAHPHDERVAHLGERLRALVERVVEREKSAGRLGAHVDVDDVVLAISMMAGVLARSEPGDRADVGRRAWALFHAAFSAGS